MKTRHPDVTADISFVPADPTRARTLTPAQVEHYNARGYIAGLPLFDAAECAAWRTYFDAHRADWTQSSGFKAYHHEVRELYDLVVTPRLVAWMNDLLGDDLVCHTSMYITKDPGDTTVVHWHQDCSYNPMDSRCAVVWIAFDDVDTENGGMWFIPGSHLLGQLEFDKNATGILETRNAETFGSKIPMDLKAGQAVIFSDQLLHMSLPNRTKDRHRRSFNATYANAALVPHLHKGDWGVLCSGRAPHDRWKLHGRPTK